MKIAIQLKKMNSKIIPKIRKNKANNKTSDNNKKKKTV